METFGNVQELMESQESVVLRDRITLNKFSDATPETAPPGTEIKIGVYPPRLVKGGMVISADYKNLNGEGQCEIPIVAPPNRLLAAKMLNEKIADMGWVCEQITSDKIPLIEDRISAQDVLKK